MARRAAKAAIPLALLQIAVLMSLLLLRAVEAVPPVVDDSYVGADVDSGRPAASAAAVAAAAAPSAAAAAPSPAPSSSSSKGKSNEHRLEALDDLTAYWLEHADELRERDARLSPEALARELDRRETEWRNAAKRARHAAKLERGGENEEDGGEDDKRSIREMERERKTERSRRVSSKRVDERSRDSPLSEGLLDPSASSDTIDASTLYSPPKATPFRAQGEAPGKLSLSKLLTEGYDPKAGGRGLAPGSVRAEDEGVPRMVLNTLDVMEEGDEEDRPKYGASGRAPPNAYGARPNDVPVVSPTPIDVSRAVRASTPIEASRLVLNDSSPAADLWGFASVSSVDQPLRRYRPPDQGLCHGNGIVIAGNNLVYRAFNATDGSVLQGPIAPQDFYGLDGDMSDPVCVYDAEDTQRFYLGMFQWGGKSGDKYSRFMLAVSRTSDPVRDGWDGPFLVRNDGLDQQGKSLPGLEACGRAGGCMGDYPTLGMDKNSLWAGFNLFGSGYSGVLVLAISKRSLVAAERREPAAVAYSDWPSDLAFTVHPTTTQAGSESSPGPTPGSGGAIFLVSTGPATQNDPSRNDVAVWAATDTAALDVDDFPETSDGGGGSPSSRYRLPAISAPALVPVPAYRDVGSFRGAKLALDQPSPGIALDGGDGRTSQAVYSGGLVWCAAQTAMHVGSPDSPLVIGVVYWAFEPHWKPLGGGRRGHEFVPRLEATGYVGAGGDTALTGWSGGKTHVGRPAITASPGGTAWIGGILTGVATNPTAVAVEVDLFEGPKSMRVGAIAPTVIYPLSPDERWKSGGGGYLRGGDFSSACLGRAEDGETYHAWMSSQWSGGVGARKCYSSFSAEAGGQGASSCPSWGTWVSRARVDVGGPSAVERLAAKRREAGGSAVGPAGSPSPDGGIAPSPSGAPPSTESPAESWMIVGKEAAAPVNRPRVEERERGKEREQERREADEEGGEEGEKEADEEDGEEEEKEADEGDGEEEEKEADEEEEEADEEEEEEADEEEEREDKGGEKEEKGEGDE